MKAHPTRSRISQERWLVSYADFITLLFGFFVVLYAFARADQKKQAQIPVGIASAFHALGLFPGVVRDGGAARQGATGIVTGEQVRVPGEVKQDLERIGEELSQMFAGEIADGSIAIAMNREGLVVSLREVGFFDSGSATPKPGAQHVLRDIASTLGQVPYDVRVEGHTDNVPVHNAAFDSNWELSAGRATAIARLFVDTGAIPPSRISAAGYGEFHPVASNATAKGRAENRRVDLVIMPRTKFDYSAASKPIASGPWRRVTENDTSISSDQGDE